MEIPNDYEDVDTVSIDDTLALEEMAKQERAKEMEELHSLCEKAQSLSADVLYCRCSRIRFGVACYDLWKTLTQEVGGTPNGWRDLGHCLNIPEDKLNEIMNSEQEDLVDMVIKVYKRTHNASLGKILDALITMKRYDILNSIVVPLRVITRYFDERLNNCRGYKTDYNL
nr:uncharacterized protein LOC110374743 [Helicoverpa armigera]